MTRNPELARFGRVFEAADAGAMTLPKAVTQARLTLATLQTVTIDRPDEGAAHAEAVHAALEAAAKGKTPGSPTVWLDARAKVAEADNRHLILNAATERAADALITAVMANADRIITEHADPAITDVLGKARAAATKATGDGDRASLLQGTPASMAAWRTLEELATRYALLRAVQRPLTLTMTYDTEGQFAEFRRGVRTVWASAPRGQAPWPETPAARLRWLATMPAELWMPTGEQRDAAWLDAYGSDEQKANARLLVAS